MRIDVLLCERLLLLGNNNDNDDDVTSIADEEREKESLLQIAKGFFGMFEFSSVFVVRMKRCDYGYGTMVIALQT